MMGSDGKDKIHLSENMEDIRGLTGPLSGPTTHFKPSLSPDGEGQLIIIKICMK